MTQDRTLDPRELRATFDAVAPLTVGIEEEAMLVDPETLALLPRAPEVIDRLHREIAAVLGEPEIRSRYATLGIEPVANSPGEFAAQIRTDLARWEKVVRQANIRVE